MAAFVGGALQLDPARGCVLLSGRPVIWPADTILEGNPPKIHLTNGLIARHGDNVRGGGGGIPATAVRETVLRIKGDLTHALSCAPTESTVVVFNARGDEFSVTAPG
jgi:hypothetical protein